MDTKVASAAPYFREPAAGSSHNILGLTHIYKATGAETAGSFSLWEAVVAPGAGAPPHTHSREDEAFYVLSGELVIELEGEPAPHRVAPGGFFFGARGRRHSFRNGGDQPARVLVLCAAELRPRPDVRRIGGRHRRRNAGAWKAGGHYRQIWRQHRAARRLSMSALSGAGNFRVCVAQRFAIRDFLKGSLGIPSLLSAGSRPIYRQKAERRSPRAKGGKKMTDLIARTFQRLDEQLPGHVSLPGDDGYAAATAIWAKPVGRVPRAVVHCRTSQDVQSAIRAARDCDLPLSVRGGGHDWACRALCDGIVIDLSGMSAVDVASDHHTARISGGARASDVAAAADPLGLAAATGSVGAVGMAGLTLGGGYGPLIGRFGLALDNLLAAEVVLANGRAVVADDDNEEDLFWALRGGGGNFGAVTAMRLRLHDLPSVRSGMLIYPFAEAKAVAEGFADIAASAPEELTAQLVFVTGPDGAAVVMIIPTWCGRPEEGEARVAPFLKLGTLFASTVQAMSYGASLTAFDAYIVNGQRMFMETCWLPALDSGSIDALIQAVKSSVSPGCAIITHEFKGAASKVPEEATAFGLRRDHVGVEILAAFADPSDRVEEQRHRQWARATRQALDAMALPGGYPNLLDGDDPDRVASSYGCNAGRLMRAKRHYDPDNVFCSAIPLPVVHDNRSHPEHVNI
jgi:quercetin dioxygenase-like cupin family protein